MFNTIEEVVTSYEERFLPAKSTGIDGVIQLELSGEGGGTYQLIITDQTLRVEPGAHPSPTVTVATTADDWLRVNNGETNPMGLLMKGRLKIRGSLPVAMKFQSMFVPGTELNA